MIINAPKVEKFKPLQKVEVDNMVQQIDQAFANGVHPTQEVAFPAMILAQLLKTVQHLASLVPPPPENENLFDDLLDSIKKDDSGSDTESEKG